MPLIHKESHNVVQGQLSCHELASLKEDDAHLVVLFVHVHGCLSQGSYVVVLLVSNLA